MKSVLISIQSKWCELIVIGAKTIEVRKTVPNIDTPFKSYIYCTKPKNYTENIWVTDKKLLGNGKVIGEFICDSIIIDEHGENLDVFERCGKMSRLELTEYGATTVVGSMFKKDKRLYGWHISDLKTYDKPKELNEFYRWYDGITDIRPCQNGRGCDHAFYDYGEDCEACRIDYDGTDCPFLKVQHPPQSWCYVEEIT